MRFYNLAPSLLGAPAEAPLVGPDVASRIHIEQIPLGESNALCTEYHYLRRGRTSAQIAYGVWYRGIGIGVVHYAYPRWSRSPYPEAPSPFNVLECARVYISNLDRRGYPIGNEKGRRVEGLAVAAFVATTLRIKADWEGKYPHLPRVTALVSWSDNTRHPGRLYELAGWRLDTTKSKGHKKGSTWHHMNGTEKTYREQIMHPDYLNDKSRWSLILDDFFLQHEGAS
jgi:hypothetical protein